jgi:Zn-dependent protease with chaperone function
VVFNWRWILFAIYISLFLALPLSILWNIAGLAVGVSFAIAVLISLRWQGTKQLCESLKLKSLLPTERPEVSHIVQEYCRRLSLPLPQIKVIETKAYNIAVFGFSKNDAVIALTRGVLSLPREQLSALLARATSTLWHRDFIVETWLSRYLMLFIRPQERPLSRRFYSTRVLVKQILLYPFTVIPSLILKGTTSPEALDLKAARLCQNPRALAEALRVLEASRERIPLNVPFAFARLFLIPPPLHEFLFHFISVHSSFDRIRKLESFSQLVNPV